MPDTTLQRCLATTKAGKSLPVELATACLAEVFEGQYPDAELKSLLLALNKKGITVSEVVGFATAMRAKMVPITLPGPILDVCGTGGSGKDRFNISTAMAFVLAAGGVGIAKHGNYGSQKTNGSFDFLEALGIPFGFSPNQQAALFRRTQCCFLFARTHHPAMKHVGPVRKEIGQRTIFNLLGPLCNPAGAMHQVLGTTDAKVASLIAQALQQLGCHRATVVVGADHLDECAMSGDNIIITVTPDNIDTSTFNPLVSVSNTYPKGNAKENAALFEDVFSAGDAMHPLAKHVCINAGIGFYTMGTVNQIEEGIQKALTLVETKRVWDKVKDIQKVSQEIQQKGEL